LFSHWNQYKKDKLYLIDNDRPGTLQDNRRKIKCDTKIQPYSEHHAMLRLTFPPKPKEIPVMAVADTSSDSQFPAVCHLGRNRAKVGSWRRSSVSQTIVLGHKIPESSDVRQNNATSKSIISLNSFFTSQPGAYLIALMTLTFAATTAGILPL
jgi:hypothetical protein